MKRTNLLARKNLTAVILLLAMAGSLLLVGCTTSDSGDYRSSAPSQGGHQHSHH